MSCRQWRRAWLGHITSADDYARAAKLLAERAKESQA